MTEEEQQRYVEIGMAADIKIKAGQVESALNHLKNTFAKASGMYVPSRFAESIGNMHRSLDEFQAAMKAKEAYASARRRVGKQEAQAPEGGRLLPVEHGSAGAEEDDSRPHRLVVLEPRDDAASHGAVGG